VSDLGPCFSQNYFWFLSLSPLFIPSLHTHSEGMLLKNSHLKRNKYYFFVTHYRFGFNLHNCRQRSQGKLCVFCELGRYFFPPPPADLMSSNVSLISLLLYLHAIALLMYFPLSPFNFPSLSLLLSLNLSLTISLSLQSSSYSISSSYPFTTLYCSSYHV
jgi:hypothetical protein